MTVVKDDCTPIGFEAFSRLVDLVCETDSTELYGEPNQKLVKPIRRVTKQRPSNFLHKRRFQTDFRTTPLCHHA